jgi:hypothetical protein
MWTRNFKDWPRRPIVHPLTNEALGCKRDTGTSTGTSTDSESISSSESEGEFIPRRRHRRGPQPSPQIRANTNIRTRLADIRTQQSRARSETHEAQRAREQLQGAPRFFGLLQSPPTVEQRRQAEAFVNERLIRENVLAHGHDQLRARAAESIARRRARRTTHLINSLFPEEGESGD